MDINHYFKLMMEQNASDLFLTTGAPVCVKVEGVVRRMSRNVLEPGEVKEIAYRVMNDRQISEFETTKEMNFGISVDSADRFRMNLYCQRGEVAMVMRHIKGDIPDMESLGLPHFLNKLVMQKKGLVLIVGPTESGKSTTLASMIDYRNQKQAGHILTIEDPIEYMFSHKQSIVGQREVGIDTLSYENALRGAMREAPDLIMIGEVNDKKVMEAAIAYADAGNLCLTTLHAVNSSQALDRITNLFPAEARAQVLVDLSLNLCGIISQRLIPDVVGGRTLAIEILINTPYIAELIQHGDLDKIKTVMEKGGGVGMCTFDQSLCDLYKSEKISLDEALGNADSRDNLEWKINFGGGVKSVSESSDQPMFSSEFPEQLQDHDANTFPTISDGFKSDDPSSSFVGFSEGASVTGAEDDSDPAVEPANPLFEENDGQDEQYLDQLKSVLKDK